MPDPAILIAIWPYKININIVPAASYNDELQNPFSAILLIVYLLLYFAFTIKFFLLLLTLTLDS